MTLGDPKRIAEFETTHDWFYSFLCEFVLYVISILLRSDFASIQHKLDSKSASGYWNWSEG